MPFDSLRSLRAPFSFRRGRRAAALQSKGEKKLRDRDAASKSWRDDVLDGVAVLEGVRERFEKEKDEGWKFSSASARR